jgi:DNA-binding transcriptional LysR family regulator
MENVHQLRVFATLAQNLSFTRTAEALFLTQSAVSHQIARLERELAAELFVRHGRSVSLTPAGQALLRHVRQIFACLEEATTAVRKATRPELGRLRIGASLGACQYIIPETLREFRESFPGYGLTILPGDTPRVSERLVEGSIDLGIVIRTDKRATFRYDELFEDELGVLVNPLHPWAKAGAVNRRELADQDWILYSRSSTTFGLVERYLTKQQVPLGEFVEMGSLEATKELVKLGLGVSVTARWICLPEISTGALAWLPLPGARLKRSWCIMANAGKPASVAEQTFIGLCKAVGANLAGPG